MLLNSRACVHLYVFTLLSPTRSDIFIKNCMQPAIGMGPLPLLSECACNEGRFNLEGTRHQRRRNSSRDRRDHHVTPPASKNGGLHLFWLHIRSDCSQRKWWSGRSMAAFHTFSRQGCGCISWSCGTWHQLIQTVHGAAI